VNRYRLEDPGIESLWGRDFPHPSSPALGQIYLFIYLLIYSITFVDRNNSVDVANRYGLDGPGIE
jgi:hypothetical protein